MIWGKLLVYFRLSIYGLLIALCCFYLYRTRWYGARVEQVASRNYPSFERRYIAHAFGTVGGKSYTNTWEAFSESYAKGFRAFEVDLEFTKDNQLVCFHLGMEEAFAAKKDIFELPLSVFKEELYYKQWPTLTARQMVINLRKYPEVLLVTDTKDDFRRVITRLVELAGVHNPALLDQISPQIYGNGTDDLRTAEALHDFAFIIYTTYKGGGTDRRLLDFIELNRVSAVTFPLGSRSPEFIRNLKSRGIPSLVHPVNDKQAAAQAFSLGVAGVYTSRLVPESEEP